MEYATEEEIADELTDSTEIVEEEQNDPVALKIKRSD
jgi:hypothetical protein